MTLPNFPYKGNQIPNQPFSYPEVPATFDRLFGARVANEQLDPNPSNIVPADNDEWVRPADWLPMPNVSDTEQKVVGLFAVYNLPVNPIAVQFEGDYTVDWGDGAIEIFGSGEKAQHSYNWDAIPASTTTTQGYRQVLVTVTPQNGQDLTLADLSVRHDLVQESYPGSPWLDLLMGIPAAGTGKSIILSGPESNSCLAIVQRVQIINAGGASDFNYLMGDSNSVQEFILGPNVVSDYDYMFGFYNGVLKTIKFQNLLSLENIAGIIDAAYYPPVIVYLSNVTGVTDASFLLQNNQKVKKVVIDGAPDLVNLDNAFQGCDKLEEASISGAPNLDTLIFTFSNCDVLKKATLEDCSSVTDFTQAFSNCYNLQEVNVGETPLLFSTDHMFYCCYSLINAPDISMQSVEEADNMFDFCYSLSYCPSYDFSSVLSCNNMFKGCSALQKAPDVNMSNVENFQNMFNDCYSLTQVPEYDFSSATNLEGVFSTTPSLQLAPVKNVSVDISFADCLLGRDAIVEIFQGLAPASATIDITGNYGANDLTAEDIAIAEGKGWTVTY